MAACGRAAVVRRCHGPDRILLARRRQAVKDGYHPYFKHHHLAYDVEQGRADFEEAISDIFRRNGITLELTAAGTVERLAPDVLREALASAAFATGDKLLDATLQDAHRKFLSPHESNRRDALQKLWDAFERMKTLEPGPDKAAQANLLLDKAAQGTGPNQASFGHGGISPHEDRQCLPHPSFGNESGAALIKPRGGLSLSQAVRVHSAVAARNRTHVGFTARAETA